LRLTAFPRPPRWDRGKRKEGRGREGKGREERKELPNYSYGIAATYAVR